MSVNSWSGQVLYQIYPRSFKDSSGNGIGDLKGITAKLDYLAGKPDSLGVSAVWISPFYPSPMADFGYDISDYRGVDPIFGTLEDFKKLLAQAHKRGLKLLVDFVPNHTSDEHPWFIESKKSRKNAKRDWYIWRDADKHGRPPNNWRSVFGGSAWQFDEKSGQYFLHSFLAKQPDLNWDNPKVVAAMVSNMRFWLDLGVDGFRVDAVSWLGKDPRFRSDSVIENPAPEVVGTYEELRHDFSRNGQSLFKHLGQMTDALAKYENKIMVTEFYPKPWNNVAEYKNFYDQVDSNLCAPFNFGGILATWDAGEMRQFVDDFQSALGTNDLPVYCFGNHDQYRPASRLGEREARAAAVLHLSLPGMPCIYYGDELGMPDALIPPSEVQDPSEKLTPGSGRDHARTPMPWRNGPGSGFSRHTPWLPINSGSGDIDVADQQAQPHSMLNLYKRLLAYRADSPVLQRGKYHSFKCPPGVFGFKRALGNDKLIVLVNFSAAEVEVKLAGLEGKVAVSSNGHDGSQIKQACQLDPYEAVIIQPADSLT